MGRRVAACVAFALALAVGGAAGSSAAVPEPAVRAAGYLADRQLPNGAFSADATADAVADGAVALLVGGVTGAPVERALEFVRHRGAADVGDAPAAARVVLALVAAGANPRAFGGVDYVARLGTYYVPRTAAFDSTLDGHALAVLALVAAREPVPSNAVQRVRRSQCADGAFAPHGCLRGTAVDTTAMALAVLAAHGVDGRNEQVARALRYLRAAQNPDGGFGPQPRDPTAAASTATVVTGLVAIGEHLADWQQAGGGPVAALSALQEPDGGLKPTADATAVDDAVTMRAVPALAGRAIPLAAVQAGASTPPTTVGPASPTTVAPAPRPPAGTPPAPDTAPGDATDGEAGDSEPPADEAPQSEPRRAEPREGDREVAITQSAGSQDPGGLGVVLPLIAALSVAGALGLALRRWART